MAYRSIRWFVVAAAGVATWAAGPVTPAGDEKPTRRERFEAIKAEYDKQYAAFRKADRAVKTNAEREAADKLRPSLGVFGRRFLALAEEQQADEVACDALLWIASNYGRHEKLKLDSALDHIEKHHLNSPELKDVVDALSYADSERANALAEVIAKKAGDREVRGHACFFIGLGIYSRTGGRDEESLARVEHWMRRARKDYADVRLGNRKLGDMAEAQLFEMRNLIPGKVVPELEGVGVGGRKVKLSDYRGKVVVLVFWSSTCGPCLADVPRWRDLTAKHSKRPFTVVGVNVGDP
ncbi:MAG: peroxiredoxin family protein, partial [Gemmataceae bacterium]